MREATYNNGQSFLSERASNNFVITPMGNGRPAMMTRHHAESAEDGEDATSGIGFKLISAQFGELMGLGHWFDIAMEIMHAGMEYADDNGPGGQQLLQDVNLDPRALLRPDAAYNFKKIDAQKFEESKKVEDSSPKRTWNSGEGDLFLSKLSSRRLDSGSSRPVVRVGRFHNPSPVRKES